MDNKKVLLGMSGGVDSTASAILLKQQGYEVIGATYRLTDDENFEKSISDAKYSADLIGIDHIVVDYRNEFKDKVISNFISEYSMGHTPNPCVVCNKNIKFNQFLKTADKMGIKYVASGQYANIRENNGRYYIVKARNIAKDQTYFVYSLKENILDRVIFPMGNMISKDDTRKIVHDAGIKIYNKKDSQEICFIKNMKYTDYINANSNITFKAGNFVDTKGNILGKHSGIINYTIGQRKGLGVTFGKPVFVVDIDYKNNTVVLGENEDLFKDKLKLSNYTFINEEYDRELNKLTAKIRYAAKEENVVITKENDGLLVKFENPVRAITKGQSVVFYDGDILVGGGIIE
ncbi:tRNA 2-thiouridine(34) synthase MnmA [Sedimentibacter sp. zth1]|uniref:tRNA 2-thiouridine(34) synthase MnmA n=1 Tax=Sedimentibacter sp. zth1 TaxID=2816908 RepID=UPI001F5E3A5C|nr:tRNA 2-thiouridine(34) synthase MnmA [Sedimentibacter sp. zth1]